MTVLLFYKYSTPVLYMYSPYCTKSSFMSQCDIDIAVECDVADSANS